MSSEKGADWRDDKSGADCLRYLGEKKLMSDVKFRFSNDCGKSCTAHKLILGMRSEVFEAMFYGSLAETSDEITIEDVDADTFELLLSYIYSDRQTLNGENVLKCLFAAKKYCLDGLVKICSSFLENSKSPSNVCSIHEQALFFDMPDLRKNCHTYILENAADVFADEDFLKLKKECLSDLFGDENLKCTELQCFDAACRWADAQCKKGGLPLSPDNKREMLDGILEKIRFPVMTSTEFAVQVAPTNILTPNDQITLFQFFITRSTTTPGLVEKYMSMPRTGRGLTTDFLKVASSFSQHKQGLIVRLNVSHAVRISVLKMDKRTDMNSKLKVVLQDPQTNARLELAIRKPIVYSAEEEGYKFLDGIKIPAQKDVLIVMTETDGPERSFNGVFANSYKHSFIDESVPFGEVIITFKEIPEILKGLHFKMN